MPFTSSLKIFFNSLVDYYGNFGLKNIRNFFILVVFSGLLTALLYYINPETGGVLKKMNFFAVDFYSTSRHGHYSFTDLSMIVFLALIALFSVSVFRMAETPGLESKWPVFGGLNGNDFFVMSSAVVLVCISDAVFSYLINLNIKMTGLEASIRWMKLIVYYIRAYVPVLAVSIAVTACISPEVYRVLVIRYFPLLLLAAFIIKNLTICVYFLYDGLVLNIPGLFISEPDTVFLINIFLSMPMLCFIIPAYMALINLLKYLEDKSGEVPNEDLNIGE